MTVRVSWLLVLGTFTLLVLAVSLLGLFALSEGKAVVAQLAPAAGETGAALKASFADFASGMQLAIVAAWLATLASVGVVLWGVTVNVVRPLGELVGFFRRMQEGHLAQSIPRRGNNEIGRLYRSLDEMQHGLADTVGTVRNASESIYHGTQHIAHGNNDLSARTEQQASSLQETAASMEELSSTVNQTADNARQASQLASDASRAAQQGGEVVSEVVSTMHEISQGSHRVAEIIGTIDAIAFQTNILALNASVEAARAGEHGRGFAVVAQEVRNLATRSANASSEIRMLIQTSVTQVEAGTSRADRAGQAMREIVTAVQRVSDIMGEIASASSEQSSGIAQVNDAVAQMDQVTQQNAELVQQAANAANQLEAEASRLKAAVTRFQLGKQAVVTQDARPPHEGEDNSLARWMPTLMPAHSMEYQQAGEGNHSTAQRQDGG
nr:methyl-accepting chemotaxis protein [Halomonas ventosae]